MGWDGMDGYLRVVLGIEHLTVLKIKSFEDRMMQLRGR